MNYLLAGMVTGIICVSIAELAFTEENNLQTLCWKCNRSKGDKIL